MVSSEFCLEALIGQMSCSADQSWAHMGLLVCPEVSYRLVRSRCRSWLSSVMCPQLQLGQQLIELCAMKSLICQQVSLRSGRIA